MNLTHDSKLNFFALFCHFDNSCASARVVNSILRLCYIANILDTHHIKHTLYHSFESECLGVELDGSETLRAWGRGKNRTDAIEQAKKNAVRDVLFKGVAAGSRECSVRPLVTEVNAQERYAYYFNDFFRDGGEYLKYVSMEDKKTNSNMKTSNKTQISYSTTVRVLRSQLQQKLIEDKILKP